MLEERLEQSRVIVNFVRKDHWFIGEERVQYFVHIACSGVVDHFARSFEVVVQKFREKSGEVGICSLFVLDTEKIIDLLRVRGKDI